MISSNKPNWAPPPAAPMHTNHFPQQSNALASQRPAPPLYTRPPLPTTYTQPTADPTQWVGSSRQGHRGLTEMFQDSLTNLNLPHTPPTNGILPAPQLPMNTQTPAAYQPARPQVQPPQGVFLSLPVWMRGKGSIPPLYQQVTALYADPRQTCYIHTDRIQPVLLSSKLDKEKLKLIWSICNQTVPGVLTLTECYTVLGLIALAQQGHEINVDTLATFSFIPIPTLDTTSHVPVGAYPQGVNVPRYPVPNPAVITPNGVPIPSQQPPNHVTMINFEAENTQLPVMRSQSAKDDSFGDFQSAFTDKPSSHTMDISSEFGELKSAPMPPANKLDLTDLAIPNKNPTLPPSTTLSPLDPPALPPATDTQSASEDKYSCFRVIDTSSSSTPHSDGASVFSGGGSGLGATLLEPDNSTDKYSYLRALDENSDQKNEPPLLTHISSNSLQPAKGLSEFKPVDSQTQIKDLSFFKQAATTNNTTMLPAAGKQADAVATEFSDFSQFTCADNFTQPKKDPTPPTSDFFDPADFSVFQSASTNQTCTLTSLELGAISADATKVTTPTDPPALAPTSINRTQTPVEELSPFQTAAVNDPKPLLTDLMAPIQNQVDSNLFTAPVKVVDDFIPFQSAPQESNSTHVPLNRPAPTNMNAPLPNNIIPHADVKPGYTPEFDIFHSTEKTTILDFVMIPSTSSDPMFIPTSIPSTFSDPILIPTGVQSNPVLIPSSTDVAPLLPPTSTQSITNSDIILPSQEPPPLPNNPTPDQTQDGETSNINPNIAKPTSKVENFSLFNEPPPLDDGPPDAQSGETDDFNFSGFQSYPVDENPDSLTHETQLPTQNATIDVSTNPDNTTIFSTLNAAVLPSDADIDQDPQQLDTTPLAIPPHLFSEECPPPPASDPEKTPLAAPPVVADSQRDDNLQDLVFNFAQLNTNNEILVSSNLHALPSNPSSNYSHSASEPLNSDLVSTESEDISKEAASTDFDPFLDLGFETSDLMKRQSSKLAQPKWTLFDTFSNALQDINSVPIDNYKNQKFKPKKEVSNSFPREESFSHKRTTVTMDKRELEFEEFKAAMSTERTDIAHKPLVRAPSYKLSDDSTSELKEAWSHLLSSCLAVVHTCLEKVKSATSVHVLKELCSHKKSKQYFDAVFEVMKIVCRIKKQVPDSWDGHTLSLDDIALDWANIKAYLNHGGLEFSDIPTEVKGEESGYFCGVCLDIVGEGECRISFGGYNYHNTCANFWLNEVRNMLPRLTQESHGSLL